MSILEEFRKSSPSKIIDLLEADFTGISSTPLPSGGFYLRYFNDSTELGTNIVWNGLTFTSYPYELKGIEWTGAGTLPTPRIILSNINGLMTALNLTYDNLLGLKITRYRTMLKYLDDPTSSFAPEVYYVDRMVAATNTTCEYELVSALDISSVKLPRRLVIQNTCQWKYKDSNCNYDPAQNSNRMFTSLGVATEDSSLDVCGKRLSDCKARFGSTSVLNYGGFPGAGLFN